MKLVNIKIAALCSALLLTSCSLDETNYSAVTDKNYITGETQYEELVNAAYMYMRPLCQKTNCMWYGTDNYSIQGLINGQNGIQDYYYVSSSEGAFYDFWCANYDVINKCNTAMTRGEELSLSESTKTLRTAELLALRSYCYFNLVETFGGVPLVLEESDSPTYEFIRNTEEEVYNQIVSDIKTAINTLPSTLSSSDFGRVDKAFAEHLLGKVLLTRSYKSFAESSDVTDAINYFKDVISLHPMVSSWDELFNAQEGGSYNETNSEIIFAVRFGKGTNNLWDYTTNSEQSISSGLYQHFHFNVYMFPGNTHRGAPYYRNDYAYQPTLAWFNSFEENDERVSETFLKRHILAGTSGTTENAVTGKTVTFTTGDEIIYFPRTAMNEEEKKAYMNEHPTVYLIVNPNEYHTQFAAGNMNCAWPLVYKFYDPYIAEQGVYSGSISDGEDPYGAREIYIFRTAETKLLLAEAYLKSGNSHSALLQVNDIRKRVGATELTNVDLDIILDESGRELFGESNRWMDLKRSDKLFERAYKYNEYVQLNQAGGVAGMNANYKVRPIPLTERQRTNYSLEQNPGYDE